MNVLFRSYTSFFPVIIAINVGLSLLGLILSLTSLASLRRNFPRSSTDASPSKIKRILCCVFIILLLQGAIGIGKEALTLLYIIYIERKDDTIFYKNDERIFIQDLVISFFAFLPFMVLLIGVILLFVFYFVLLVAHIFLFLMSCFRISLYARFQTKVRMCWKKMLEGGI